MTDLYPCPFCCSDNSFVERIDLSSCAVICNHCTARGPESCPEDDEDLRLEEENDWEPGEAAARRLWNRRTPPEGMALAAPNRDMVAHMHRQIAFSARAFGPGERQAGVVDHIRKELREIEEAPHDLEEWIDVVLLALDGAWRSGHSAEEVVAMLDAKMSKNEAREWPDWRTADRTKAIEHDRTKDREATE